MHTTVNESTLRRPEENDCDRDDPVEYVTGCAEEEVEHTVEIVQTTIELGLLEGSDDGHGNGGEAVHQHQLVDGGALLAGQDGDHPGVETERDGQHGEGEQQEGGREGQVDRFGVVSGSGEEVELDRLPVHRNHTRPVHPSTARLGVRRHSGLGAPLNILHPATERTREAIQNHKNSRQESTLDS